MNREPNDQNKSAAWTSVGRACQEEGTANAKARFGFLCEQEEGWLVRRSRRWRKDLIEIKSWDVQYLILIRSLDFIVNVMGSRVFKPWSTRC